VKRRGGCGLVVTEMVSSEGLVRGIDRTLEYAEYTEEERPVSIQIFGGDPRRWPTPRRSSRAWAPTSSTSTWAARSEDRQAQRRVQPDARAGARAGGRRAMAKAVQHSR
jgi:hypothetical protein